MNIGAAIIVKNGECTIAKALNSVYKICSQIVVVDTGSEDSTCSICTKYGAEIHFKKWEDDFSKARNYALALMRTEWIIVIDADEELVQENFDKQAHLLDNKTISGINVKLRNLLDSGKIYSEHRYTRIFRNMPEHRFEGKIHEQIRPSIERMNGIIANSEIVINHSGYSEKNPDKLERNKKLLEMELSSQPKDAWLKYHLAETEFAAGNSENARILFITAIESGELTSEQIEKARLRLAQIALANDDINELSSMLEFSSENIDREGFRLYLLATGKLVSRDFDTAYNLYNSDEILQSSLVDKEKVFEARIALEGVLNQINKIK